MNFRYCLTASCLFKPKWESISPRSCQVLRLQPTKTLCPDHRYRSSLLRLFIPNYALQIPKKEILSLMLVYYTSQIYLNLSPKRWTWFLIYFFGIWSRKGLPISPNLLCCRALEVPKYVYAPSASNLRQTRQLHNPGLLYRPWPDSDEYRYA